jgi:23S rRNA (adenine2503-C2)-methyltransferase
MTTLPLVFDAPARPRTPPRHLADLSPAERRAAVAELGLPAYRAGQLSQHYFARLTDDPAAMTDLPGRGPRPAGRGAAAHAVDAGSAGVLRRRGDPQDALAGVRRRAGGERAHALPGPGHDVRVVPGRLRMACPFCATGQGGLTRNLSAAEIVEQVVAGARWLRTDSGERLSNVVFMGMGEPLANYNRVIGAVRRLTDPAPDGLGLSQRSVVVSTVGLVPAIRRLAGEGLQVTLAVSLHAPDDELRDTLVPVNTRWPVAEVLSAARAYADATGRRVSIEYALIRDVNDQPRRARMLGELLADTLGTAMAHVNLIPLNPTPGSEWDASPLPVQREFVRLVRAAGVSTTVRDTRGRDIAGACGQLAARE